MAKIILRRLSCASGGLRSRGRYNIGGFMINERIILSDDGRACLDTYVTFNTSGTLRGAILICPGGGYHGVSPREAEPIALAFAAKGFNTFVLWYRVGQEGDVYPRQLVDASRAILHIRENAEKYGIIKEKVAVLGFSAGGHLAGSLATMYDDPELLEILGADPSDIRPDAAVLCYPVITAYEPTHKGSFKNLLGKEFDQLTDEEREKFSIEKRVNLNTPPMFIWHTAKDKGVPLVGSLALTRRLFELDIPVSTRIYPYGGHGLALGNEDTASAPSHIQPIAAKWIDEAAEFLATL